MAIESVRKVADTALPTRYGDFRILGFEGILSGATPCCNQARPSGAEREQAVALVMGEIKDGGIAGQPPLVRIHSQCLTGDVFHSLRCDCRQQLELALHTIAQQGAGIIVYDQQEGRGIGLMAKLKAYELQEQGRDTVEANIELGYRPDCREFELQAAVLSQLGITSVRLMTNNPEKVAALERAGVKVVERVPAEVPVEETFERYLQVKQEKMGHIFRTDGTVETISLPLDPAMGEMVVDPAGATLDLD
ncbi:MAG TPA: GTP cyclohydrolase II [Acidobacteriaceae bacterium]